MRAGIVVMMSRWSFAFAAGVGISLFSAHLFAGIGDWKNYTDMKVVRAVASDGRGVWAATSGGVFRFDSFDSTYQKFVNSDGLSSNDITAITVDTSGNVWIGQQNGSIDIYSPSSRSWRYITNITDDDAKSNKAIHAFFQDGDRMLIGTAFGVTVFSISKFEFSDTYLVFDQTVNQPSVAALAVFENRIFLATSAGLIASDSGASNLADPSSWTRATPVVSTGNAFGVLNGSLYCSSTLGLLKFQNNGWSVTNGIASSVRIVAALDTAVVMVNGSTLQSLNVAGVLSTLSSAIPATITSGTVTQTGKIFVAFAANGIGSMNSQAQWEAFVLNGPNANSFYKMVVDDRGDLWSASGGHSGGWGFYRFDGSQWTNYTTANTPLLLTNDCYAIAVGPNNSKWVSTWGEGVVLVNEKGEVVRRFDYDYPGFTGVIRSATAGIPSYTVPSKIAVDRYGTVWLTAMFSADRNKVIWKMSPDSVWQSLPGLPPPSDYAFMYEIVIDRNNTKWFTNSLISRTESPIVAYYNDERNIGGLVNHWGMLTESDGLTDDRVQAMVMDNEGDIWMGTGVGITIINETLNPPQRISKVFDFSVRDLFINCLAVDPLNNKWVGTSKGVFVLSPDGTQQLHHYSVETTGGKLIDDNIFSLAIDGKRGIVYFGTEKGLSSLEIAATTMKNQFTTIDLSPNPVYLPNQSTVEIRGLVEESSIKVMALNGKVIKQFAAQGGGRAFWDCKDGEGRTVASGVYIIVAHNRAGDQVASAKVAVIQQ